MSDIQIGADGAPRDGVGHEFATPDQLARFKDASDTLSLMKAPLLFRNGDSHDRVFFVAFDGTGNNQFKDPDHATNVAKIANDLRDAAREYGGKISAVYIVGPGTQDSWIERAYDSGTGASYEENINQAYRDFVLQANEWRQEDPLARIRVQSIGFSRGASQVAGFANLVHENGVPDLKSRTVGPDGEAVFTRNLIEPGKTAQVVGLFDPVATGAPMKFDRRLPTSVVSGFQITAGNEFRASFPSDQIIPPGLSEDGRFLNIMVPGAHSDVGGGYLRNGLSIRCGNLMRDYCNATLETPLLANEYEPADKRLNVIHHSVRGQLIFHIDPRVAVRGMPSGTNTVLAPPHMTERRALPVGTSLDEDLLLQGPQAGNRNLPPKGLIHFSATPEALAFEMRSPSYGRPAMAYAAAVATAVDFERTRESANATAATGNTTGAVSQVLHFGGRNVGGLAGAGMFASAAAAAGVESGPGAIVAAGIGAIVGATAGERLMDEFDRYRIYNQTDSKGHSWELDAKHGWSQHLPPLPETPQGSVVTASPELARQLTFQANRTATELALAKDDRPKDPYTQPSEAHDAPTASAPPWTRDPTTQEWSRHVVDQYLEHGLARSHDEVATPARAAELDARAEATIKENVAQSKLGIAERFVEAYEQESWYELGKVPPAVQHALLAPTDKVLASDGHAYVHNPDGNWSRPGLFGSTEAKGNVRNELDRSEQLGRETSQRADAELASVDRALPPPPPTRLDDPGHPDHELFKQARSHVAEVDKSLGRTPDQYTDNLASALAVQARKDGLSRIDQVALSTDGNALWAVQTPPGRRDHLFDIQTKVATTEALTPMAESGAKWPASMEQFKSHQQEAAMAHQQAQERQQQESVGRGHSL
ncbi:DUF2235 domain-containing protein [Luteibacter aegosomaticola]|uniref:T6SS phospholipase effector Tle1-like catalytic domain-containing protein n=1 Tax=Luteibacter aegosomaticola TaxID=2911538 RepID=UPI001FFA713C|nr:DUF2235 domain-containing protein [Luteibacter aegosomaticola]UPG89433.1 DUF2235 domain-containing protein [Luteibacter aegosomaticola]